MKTLKISYILLFTGIAVCATSFSDSQTNHGSQELITKGLVERVADLEREVTIPIGAVVAWWGDYKDLPAGFEICDGGQAQPGSDLKVIKPNLVDKFIKGSKGALNIASATVIDHGDHGGNAVLDLSHTHASGSLYAAIPQKRVSNGNFNVPNISRASFKPEDMSTGVNTPSAANSGNWTGREDGNPRGTAVFGDTGNASTSKVNLSNVDIRPPFVGLYYIIKVKNSN